MGLLGFWFFADKALFLILLKSLQALLSVLEMGLYVNLSRSEVEDFDMDGKFQPAFRLPVLTVNSATAKGAITYRAAEPNYKPHQLALCPFLLASCCSEGWVRGSG